MKRFVLFVVGLAFVAVLGFATLQHSRAKRQRSAADVAAFQRIDQDVRMTTVADTLHASASGGRHAIVNVNLIDPVAGAIKPGQTVLVQGDRIEWVGEASQAPAFDGAAVVDGVGRYLSPGLTDMHVHTEHMAQHMLRLAAGVTSVRDMDGFPWLLRTRDAIQSGKMIGATTYVAGTIIADRPLLGYAVVARTPEEARQIVSDQAACGYAFIKVHNSLAEPLFDAVADEARLVHLDLVGHIPHDISIQHAVQLGGMRTLEHLKGFLFDKTLLPSDEPYASALEGAEVWQTPTLYTRVGNAHGDEARHLAADPRQRYSPRSRREEWLAGIPVEGSNDAKMHDRSIETQQLVMKRLLPLHPRWLVGTDAAGYSFNIAGFAMHDEMVLLQKAGLSNAEIIRAATSEPAVAMRRPDDYGRIGPGMRADLILLAGNPLDYISAYQSNLGVMARGLWYDRTSLDTALEGIAHIYEEPVFQSIDPSTVQWLVSAAQDRVKAGYVFEDMALTAAADALARNGAAAAAQVLRTLISAPTSGVCAALTPG